MKASGHEAKHASHKYIVARGHMQVMNRVSYEAPKRMQDAKTQDFEDEGLR